MPLYTGDITFAIRQPLDLEEYKPSTWEVLKSEWQTGVAMNPLQSLDNLSKVNPTPGGQVDGTSAMTAGIGGVIAGSFSPVPAKMPVEEQKTRIADAGLEGRLVPNENYSAEVLDTIIQAKKEEISRQFIYEKATRGQAIAGFGAGMAAGFIDPVNIASTLVPLPGPMELRVAQMMARAGSIWGRAGVRAIEGAATGTMGAVLVEPMVAAGQHEIQADYTAVNSLMNVAGGAILGATLRSAGGTFAEARRNARNRKAIAEGRMPEAHPWEYVPPSEESIALRQQHANDIYEALRPSEAGKDLDKLRIHSDDLAAAYDTWARHIAYREQIPVQNVYDRWKLEYQSGEVYDAHLAEAQNVVARHAEIQEEIKKAEAQRELMKQSGLPVIDRQHIPNLQRQLAENEKLLPEAQKLIAEDEAIRRSITVEQIEEGLARLERESIEWANTIDSLGGAMPQNPVRMLSQTPLIMRLLDTDPRAPVASAEGGIFVSPHAFDGKHPNIGPNELKQLPKAMADPVAILDSETHPGDLIFLTEIMDKYGATVVIPVELNARRGRVRGANRAKSVYAKDHAVRLMGDTGAVILPNDTWVVEQLNKNARYVNGQKLEAWRRASGSNSLRVPEKEVSFSNSSGFKIFNEADLVKLRELHPTMYQAPPSRANAVGGGDTQILGANGVADPARYEVWELADLIPSHDPQNQFARRKNYPAEAQERPYHSDVGEQGKVLKNSRVYKPEFVINSDPTAGNGPPIVTGKGIVLGGNSRAMTLDLVYANNPEAAKAYRTLLEKQAGQFGIDPKALQAMKQPVLVRVMEGDPDIPTMARKSREYNQSTTQRLQAEAEAISRSRFFSTETLAHIANGIEQNGSLARFLNTNESIELARRLVDDGVLLENEHSSFTNKAGRLNDQGKKLVQNALRGLIVQDYDTLALLPSRIAEKLDVIVSAVTRMKAKGAAWDLSGAITDALRLINKADVGKFELETWFGQGAMVGDAMRDNPALQVLALTFKNADAKEVRARMEIFATEAENGAGGQQSLFGGPTVTPDSAFRKAFLKEAASVDGIHFGAFNPEKNRVHAALQWVKDSKKGTVESALEKLQKQLANKKLTEEQKAVLMSHRGELARFVGKVDIYPPKLGENFSTNIPGKLHFPPPPKAGEPRPPISLVPEKPVVPEISPEASPTPPEPVAPAVPDSPQLPLIPPPPPPPPRGSATFIGNERILIRFFRSADFSTAPHELYHVIQRQLEELANEPGANPEFAQMWQAACKFVGAEEGAAWTTAQHEKFAKAAERYFLDGITPNLQMKPILERMREEMLDVYSEAQAKGLEISDEMRSVFDSMLIMPAEKAELTFECKLAELNARKWEREFYDPAATPDPSGTPHAADLANDQQAGRNVIELNREEIETVIRTLEQSGLEEDSALAREFRENLAEADADLQRTLKMNKVIEDLAACTRARGF